MNIQLLVLSVSYSNRQIECFFFLFNFKSIEPYQNENEQEAREVCRWRKLIGPIIFLGGEAEKTHILESVTGNLLSFQ